jgi:hypothetical protein
VSNVRILLILCNSSNVLACVPLLVLLLILPGFNLSRSEDEISSIRWQLWQLHIQDTILLLGAGICLLTALRNGGQDYAFNSAMIVGLFAGSFLLALLFSISQCFQVNSQLLPTRLLGNPVVLGAAMFLFFSYGTLILVSTFP